MLGLAIKTPEPITFITGLSFDGKDRYVLHVVTTRGEARALACGGGGPPGSVGALADGSAFVCVDSPCGKSWTVQVDPATRAVRVTPQGAAAGKAITLPTSTLAAMVDAVTNPTEARIALKAIADQLEQNPQVAAQASMLRQIAANPDDGVVMTIWSRHGPNLRQLGTPPKAAPAEPPPGPTATRDEPGTQSLVGTWVGEYSTITFLPSGQFITNEGRMRGTYAVNGSSITLYKADGSVWDTKYSFSNGQLRYKFIDLTKPPMILRKQPS
jgi:hypothetical protein